MSSSSSPPLKNSQNLCNPLWRALTSKPLNRLSSVTLFYKWEAMSFQYFQIWFLILERVPKGGLKKLVKNLFSELAKSSQPTLESSSIQTTEQIVKCHTILEMGSHDLSPHTFRSGLRFFKGLQKGFKKNYFWTYFLPRESSKMCGKIEKLSDWKKKFMWY